MPTPESPSYWMPTLEAYRHFLGWCGSWIRFGKHQEFGQNCGFWLVKSLKCWLLIGGVVPQNFFKGVTLSILIYGNAHPGVPEGGVIVGLWLVYGMGWNDNGLWTPTPEFNFYQWWTNKSISNIDCRHIDTSEKYRYRYGHFWKYRYRYRYR